MKLIDTNKYSLPGTNGRFLHIASIHHTVREFMCFLDRTNNKVYIEEITGGHLEFISDDSLAQELADFLTEKGVIDMSKPPLPDDIWLRNKDYEGQ